MQYNQPLCGYGFPNVQSSPYVPRVIGEGEVVSALYPDGSIQYHFIPYAPQHPQNFAYTNNAYWNPYGVWFVRNSVIPLQQATHQQYKPSCQFLNMDSEMNVTVQSPPEFNLKFHNDSSTSTSDLHYFFPALRGSHWLPKVPACVQVELPSYPRKTCSCSCLSHDNSSSIRKNGTVSIAESAPMEIEKSRDTWTNTKKKSNSVVICEYEDTIPETCNKCVVTYADKSSVYKIDRDNNTQTASDASIGQRKNRRHKGKNSIKRHQTCSCTKNDSSDYDAY